VPALSPEPVWFAPLNRALDALPVANPERMQIGHQLLVACASEEGSRGPVARALCDELGAGAGVETCPWSPEP
jgi:hypothetical protein